MGALGLSPLLACAFCSGFWASLDVWTAGLLDGVPRLFADGVQFGLAGAFVCYVAHLGCEYIETHTPRE
jgi:hypothetical protein